jgi:DNA-directed RNA polymerase specialized sigma24 family protein
MESISVTVCFNRLCGGDRAHVAGLMSHFFPRMRGLAQRVLSQVPLPVLDAADVAQSAFASFWQRAERGDFAQHADRNELWRLLATITVRKARRHIGREMSEKRGGGRVLHESALSDANGPTAFAQLAQDVTTEAMDLTVEERVDSLGAAELRQVALFKLMAYTNGEIAGMLGCSERKIERKLRVIRAAWSHPGDWMEQP